jgi:hypothetical protein
MSWAARYIGIPWVAGESDCWAIARRIWREVFGWIVPAVDVDAHNLYATVRAFQGHREYARWRRVALPTDGAAVLMGKSARACHVGVWAEADGGGVVHSLEGIGVVFTPPASLIAAGWRVLGYYERIV